MKNQLAPKSFNTRLPSRLTTSSTLKDIKIRELRDTIMQSPFRGKSNIYLPLPYPNPHAFREAKSGVVFKVQSVELWLGLQVWRGERIEVSLNIQRMPTAIA